MGSIEIPEISLTSFFLVLQLPLVVIFLAFAVNTWLAPFLAVLALVFAVSYWQEGTDKEQSGQTGGSGYDIAYDPMAYPEDMARDNLQKSIKQFTSEETESDREDTD